MEHYGEVGKWAEDEFGTADLGDARRAKRLVQIAAGAASQIGAAVSSVCGKSGSQAATRLFGRDETTLGSVLEPHIKQTGNRCSGCERIIAVQDTTVLDFTTHSSTAGLGPVGSSEKSRGLLMHSVLALSRSGVALGLLGMQVWARDESMRGTAKKRRSRPVCEKESNKWLVGLEETQSAVSKDQKVLVVGDRESDLFALFVAPRRDGVDLLVRLAHNRAVDDEEYAYVYDALSDADVAGVYDVEVPRQGKRKARVAHLEVRISRVTLKVPHSGGRKKAADTGAKVWLIQAKEIDAPFGVDALDWTLLSTEEVDDFEHAVEMVRCYSMRWNIEEFHHVLKSGCRVEHLQYDTVERLVPVIGMLSVVAWRVLSLTKQSRTDPEMDVVKVADRDEVNVLSLWLRSQGEKLYEIHTVKDFAIAVARLGGFMGRKSDGMPGTKTTWQGLRNLEILVLGHKLATQHKM